MICTLLEYLHSSNFHFTSLLFLNKMYTFASIHFPFVTRCKIKSEEIRNITTLGLGNSRFDQSMGVLDSLAPPTYLLPLNFHFTSVLGLGLLHMHGFLGSQIFGGPISEQREWLRMMTLKSALVDGHLHARYLVYYSLCAT